MKLVFKNRWAPIRLLLFYLLVKLSSLLKASYIIGSRLAFFSATNCVLPLVGVFGGRTTAFSVCCLGYIVRMFLGFCNPLLGLIYHVPGFFASLYWTNPGPLIRLCIPFFCILLFICHPVGFKAFPYALYWFIPIILYFVPKKVIFLHALSSTFIAHAVGSVLWLYIAPMRAETWYVLIPFVAIERLVFATGMSLAYVTGNYFVTKKYYIPRVVLKKVMLHI